MCGYCGECRDPDRGRLQVELYSRRLGRAPVLIATSLVVGQTCNLPRCTTVKATGEWSGETFVPKTGSTVDCYYGVPTPGETLDLLAGSWYFFVGGSNTWTMYESFGNQLNPGSYAFQASRGSDEPDFTDMIMERQADGTYQQIHFAYQNTGTGYDQLEAAVPQYQNETLRISFYHAQYWPIVSTAMTKMQQGPNGWSGARRIVFAQGGNWYETNSDDRTASHLPELTAFLATHQSACAASGACFVASTSCIELSWCRPALQK